jgi:hypothetical protein
LIAPLTFRGHASSGGSELGAKTAFATDKRQREAERKERRAIVWEEGADRLGGVGGRKKMVV